MGATMHTMLSNPSGGAAVDRTKLNNATLRFSMGLVKNPDPNTMNEALTPGTMVAEKTLLSGLNMLPHYQKISGPGLTVQAVNAMFVVLMTPVVQLDSIFKNKLPDSNRVQNPDMWVPIFSAALQSSFALRVRVLQRASMIINASPENRDSIIINRLPWQLWISQLVSDMAGDSGERELIITLCFAITTALHFHSLMVHSDALRFQESVCNSLRSLQTVLKNGPVALKYCCMVLTMLVQKCLLSVNSIGTEYYLPRWVSSQAVLKKCCLGSRCFFFSRLQQNLIRLSDMVKTYLFCTPALGSADGTLRSSSFSCSVIISPDILCLLLMAARQLAFASQPFRRSMSVAGQTVVRKESSPFELHWDAHGISSSVLIISFPQSAKTERGDFRTPRPALSRRCPSVKVSAGVIQTPRSADR